MGVCSHHDDNDGQTTTLGDLPPLFMIGLQDFFLYPTEFSVMWVGTKPRVGHGLGHGIGHRVGHGLPVVNKVKII